MPVAEEELNLEPEPDIVHEEPIRKPEVKKTPKARKLRFEKPQAIKKPEPDQSVPDAPSVIESPPDLSTKGISLSSSKFGVFNRAPALNLVPVNNASQQSFEAPEEDDSSSSIRSSQVKRRLFRDGGSSAKKHRAIPDTNSKFDDAITGILSGVAGTVQVSKQFIL